MSTARCSGKQNTRVLMAGTAMVVQPIAVQRLNLNCISCKIFTTSFIPVHLRVMSQNVKLAFREIQKIVALLPAL